MKMPIKAIDCAAYLVEYAKSKGNPISNLQLQKMLFFAQVDYMTSHQGNRLFDDSIYAWQYGPVIPQVYNAYSCYGGSPIQSASADGRVSAVKSAGAQTSLTAVYEKWAYMPAWKLVAESHEPGKAWDRIYNRNGINGSGYGMVIGPDVIMESYAG